MSGRDRIQPAVPILMYHQILPDPPPAFRKYTVSPRRFALQMRLLRVTGFQTVTLAELRANRLDRCPLPPRAVLITFDDGYRDSVRYAVPILRAHGFSATFFLVTGLMGARSHWLQREVGLEFPLIDWATARRLGEWGMQCGAHSISHLRLAELAADECRRELHESRQALEQELGHQVVDLAYPYGSLSPMVRELASEAGYRSACSVRIGLSTAGDDPLTLHRVPIAGYDSMPTFLTRVTTARSPGEIVRAGRTDPAASFRAALRALRG